MRYFRFAVIGLTVTLLASVAFGVAGQCSASGTDVTCDADDSAGNLQTEINNAGSANNNTVTVEENVAINSTGGSVDTAAGNDTVNIDTGASVDTAVQTAGGDDTVNVQGNVVSLDTGEDNDTVNVTGEGIVEEAIELNGGNDTVNITDDAQVGSVGMGTENDNATLSGNANVDTLRMGSGDDSVTVDGNATVGRLQLQDDDDTVNISGNAVVDRVGAGRDDDTVSVSGNAQADDVWMGYGDDTANFDTSGDASATFYGTGAERADDQEDVDTLNITGGNCGTSDSDATRANDTIAGLDPDAGAYGNVTWFQFEIVNGQIVAVDCSGNVQFDGRFNPGANAPVAMYCARGEFQNEILVFEIDPVTVQGNLIFRLTRGEVNVALARAASSGGAVTLATSAGGDVLSANPDGTLEMQAPPLSPSDPLYVFNFNGGQCA